MRAEQTLLSTKKQQLIDAGAHTRDGVAAVERAATSGGGEGGAIVEISTLAAAKATGCSCRVLSEA